MKNIRKNSKVETNASTNYFKTI